MNRTGFFQQPGVAYAAYGVALLFLARFPSYLLPQQSELSVVLSIAPHLLLFPVVAALPAPSWARAAGYGWLVVDIATEIMALNGVPDAIFLSMKYGGHVSAALWIASASWQARGATRIVGWLLALNLGGYSFIPHGSFVILLPTLVLLPLWFVLVGLLLAQEASPVQKQTGRSA